MTLFSLPAIINKNIFFTRFVSEMLNGFFFE